MIDFALLIIVALVTWNVAAEGAWGAAAVFLSVIFAGLLAMNFFEPLANLLQANVSEDWGYRFDFISLMVLFALGVFLLRLMSEKIAPNFIAVHGRLYDVCRFGFALMTGYVTMAFVLAALHTAPLPREFLGFTPERKNFFGVTAPDREWLGFVQYVSEKSMRSSEDERIFDGAELDLPGHDNRIWPTYIIRYASRREGYAVATGAATAAPSGAGVTPGGGDQGPATLEGVRERGSGL
ncbi:MAG TPA: CvpA family protein [Planctomycetaceae bacterium]|nr:CvpA family protein [Planctomycetaceae bacterium]